MSENKESAINTSSLIDLKAELFRKQEEFKRQKLQSQNAAFIKGKASASEKKKPSIWSKKNAGVSQRAAKDYEEKLEEEDIFARSKKSLENKAKLYEKITSGNDVPDEDGSGLYLVDFQKKVIDGVFEQRDRARQEEEERQKREIEEEKQQLQEPVPDPENEEEEWVDFVDSLGRSRRCLKKDLPDLQKQDYELKDRKEKKQAAMAAQSKDFQNLRDKSSTSTLMSDDMRQELARQEWERQEKETMDAEKSGPIHYSDVRHNEIRSHGVGFYEFDKDETVRQEQMSELNKLREQTVTERSKKERIKEKRKAALEARLAKVKQRRKLKTGEQEAEDESEPKSDEEIGPKMEEKSDTVAEKTTDEITDKKPSVTETVQKPVAKIREWDIGKERLSERSEASWLEKQRAERYEEFAPPKAYFDSPRQVQQNPRHQQKSGGHGNKSVFSKIKKIRLDVERKSEDNFEPNVGQTSCDSGSFGLGKSAYGDSENFHTDNQTVGETRVPNEQTVQETETEKQTADLPLAFDPSVPPPTFMQQPSWFPQQQTGTSFSAAASQGSGEPPNQSTDTSHFQMPNFSEASYQNVINTNQIPAGSGCMFVAPQGFMGAQTAFDSSNLYMPGRPVVTQTSAPLTQTQPNIISGSLSQYTNTLPPNSAYGIPGVNAGGYNQTQTQAVTETQQQTVVPKMKILDTRLMQNEDD